MKQKKLWLLLLSACALQSAQAASGDSTQVYTHNPLFVNFPSPLYGQAGTGPFYSADPSARVWNINGKEVLYVYCSHDMEPPRGCDRMDRYHIFSTEDLKHWTDHGEILNSQDINELYAAEFPYCKGKDDVPFLWAPDCMYRAKDHTYYYYFPKCMAWKGKNGAPETVWKIFVATSKDPAKGFKVQGYLKDAVSYIDPNVFLDDDGTLYFYQGGSSHVFGGKFKKDDWTQLDGTPVEMQGVPDFHEGAWVFKRNGIYYLTYPDNHDWQLGGNQMRYCTSNSPLGPWKEGGIYMHPNGYDTAHGSVVKFKGKWYQFYHTGNYGGRGNLRSVSFDPIRFDKKGCILMIENWGKARGKTPQLGNKTVTIEAEKYNTGGLQYGYFVRPKDHHVLNTKQEGTVGYISKLDKQEWVRYSVNAQLGNYTITVRCRVADGKTSSKLVTSVDGIWANKGQDVQGNGWKEVTFRNVPITHGAHYLEIRCLGAPIEVDKMSVKKE